MNLSIQGLSKTHIFLLLLMCIGAFLRLQDVEKYHYNLDESVNLQLAQGDSAAEVMHFSLYETNPPLGNLIRHYWLKMGDSPWFVRSLSLVFGLLLIPLYYQLGFRLAGPPAGGITALLMTFSDEAITQSFMLRSYTILVFFLSLCLNYFLCLRQQYSRARLLAYLFWGLLALLTHFSAIFLIFCLFACEAVSLLRSRNWRELALWAAANAIIGGVFIALLFIWHDFLGNPHLVSARTLQDALAETLWYPASLLCHLLPAVSASGYARAMFIAAPFILLGLIVLVRGIALQLLLVSLVLGMVLVFFGLYPLAEGRHAMWIMPALLPAFGVAFAKLKLESKHVRLVIILMVGFFALVAERDNTEYYMTNRFAEKLVQYRQSLSSSHVIISSKGEVPFLRPRQNPYNVIAMGQGHLAAEMPYEQARILFTVRDWFFDSATDIPLLLQDAEARQMLKPGDIMVFFVSTAPLEHYMHCAELKKQVRFISESGEEKELHLSHAYNSYIAVMEVSFEEWKRNAGKCDLTIMRR